MEIKKQIEFLKGEISKIERDILKEKGLAHWRNDSLSYKMHVVCIDVHEERLAMFKSILDTISEPNVNMRTETGKDYAAPCKKITWKTEERPS
jgi:hypothetical protein